MYTRPIGWISTYMTSARSSSFRFARFTSHSSEDVARGAVVAGQRLDMVREGTRAFCGPIGPSMHVENYYLDAVFQKEEKRGEGIFVSARLAF